MVQKAEILLSYARADRDRVLLLKNALEAEGWSVGWDEQLPPGDRFRDAIMKCIGEVRCVIVAWSESSVGSDWVRTEADKANNRHILIPVVLDEGIEAPPPFGELQQVSLVHWDGNTETLDETLIRAVSRLVGPPPLVKLLRRFATRSARKSKGVALYDDVCLALDSFGGEEQLTVARIVRDVCQHPEQLLMREAYNRYDVIPILVESVGLAARKRHPTNA